MRSKYVFERMELDGEIIAVPVGDNASELHAVLYLNEEALRILELLQEETNEQKIVTQLLSEYDITEEELQSLVHSFIEELRQNGFIVE